MGTFFSDLYHPSAIKLEKMQIQSSAVTMCSNISWYHKLRCTDSNRINQHLNSQKTPHTSPWQESYAVPDSKVHEANMRPTWFLSAPDGPMLAPWTLLSGVPFVRIGRKYGPVTMIVPASSHQVRCILWVQMGTFNKEFGFLCGLKFFALHICCREYLKSSLHLMLQTWWKPLLWRMCQ